LQLNAEVTSTIVRFSIKSHGHARSFFKADKARQQRAKNMRLATIKLNNEEVASIVVGQGFIPIALANKEFGKNWPTDMLELIRAGKVDEINQWYREGGDARLASLGEKIVPREAIQFAPLVRRPRKIWGIGLNYRDHAADLAETSPTAEPASFMKPDTAIIGDSDTIEIPLMSEKTTAEAELGIVFGKTSKHVSKEDWQSAICGYVSIIDMTAEDILRRNPRNLTQSKSFDTFISLGPILVTPDEVADVNSLQVKTLINGRTHAENVVSNMTFPPNYLVSYHSDIMTLLPGDILSTGTPGAVHINDGDVVECHIDGFEPLVNQVVDLKL
jgi:2-keto-4-pentenoate hydratase/2-oxohepta-3-ene-1,7-dioic acid hydratase in catechol pathway